MVCKGSGCPGYRPSKKDFPKRPYPTEWNYEKELEREHLWSIPSDPRNRLPTGLVEDLQQKLRNLTEQKDRVELEKENIRKEIDELCKDSLKSFLESVTVSNALSVRNIKRHGELQNKALRWLYNKGYIADGEIPLPNGKRADVAGFDRKKRLIIIEVKITIEDFMNDDKWQSYLDYCDEFYFLLAQNIPGEYFEIKKAKEHGAGLLVETINTVQPEVPSLKENEVHLKEDVIWSINKRLAQVYVFGFG